MYGSVDNTVDHGTAMYLVALEPVLDLLGEWGGGRGPEWYNVRQLCAIMSYLYHVSRKICNSCLRLQQTRSLKNYQIIRIKICTGIARYCKMSTESLKLLYSIYS